MTTSTQIALAAAVVAVLAVICALSALFVAMQARRNSQKSTEAALRANELMARQIEVAVQDYDRKQKQERAASQPSFAWRDGSFGGMYCEANFQNTGGDASELSVRTDVSDVGISIDPQDLIPKSGMGKVTFRKGNDARSLPVPFTINCKTRLGENWGKSFRLMEWSTIKVVEA
jgi:type II secretory pathway pseudopilin PulG